MAGLNVVGDLSHINERQLEYIKSVIESRGFKDYKAVINPMCKAGDNYIAVVKRIIVEDGKGGTFKMVAKVAPLKKQIREMSYTRHLFKNEHIMYTKVLPKMTEIEKDADVPKQDRLRYAACYGSLLETSNEVILLEDLNESNFLMLNRLKPLHNDCIKSVLKNFAVLHSLGFALKKKEPELFEEYQNSFFDLWHEMEVNNEGNKYFKHLEKGLKMIVESDYYKKKVATAISDFLTANLKIAVPDKNSKHSIILQGDAWTNNIMFRFDGDRLLESVMIDYQMSRVGKPIVDLLYLIFNCTDYETRKDKFHEWIEYYHNELDKSLSNYGLRASYMYPKDQLDADLKRYGKIGLGQAIMLSSVLSQKEEEVDVMKQVMETTDDYQNFNITTKMKPETLKLIKKRVEGVIDSFREFGLM